MKRIISSIIFLILTINLVYSAFSFTIDGIDSGVEWDGASVYKLVEGESNSGVSFGLVKVKFDYEGNAVCLCFQFIDMNLTADNQSAGVFLTVDNSASFEIVSSDVTHSENIASYSFDGAIYLDDNNGATCEIRVGIKSGLPETIDFDARFIDSNGFYSDIYHFIIVNENYEITHPTVIYPTADNDDPAYNPDLTTFPTEKSTRKKTTKTSAAKKTTINRTTTRSYDSYIKTLPSEEYTVSKTTDKTIKSDKTSRAEKSFSTEKIVEKIYYEKEVYISEVYITNPVLSSSDVSHIDYSESDSTSVSDTSSSTISLSKGTKYKKIISYIALSAFIAIACFGTYSAKKSKNSSVNKD